MTAAQPSSRWRFWAGLLLVLLVGVHLVYLVVVVATRVRVWPLDWAGLPTVPLALPLAAAAMVFSSVPRALRVAGIVVVALEVVVGVVVGVAMISAGSEAAIGPLLGAGAGAVAVGVLLVVPGAREPAPEPAQADHAPEAPAEGQAPPALAPVWQPDEAVGTVWNRAGDAATGAPGWQPENAADTWPQNAPNQGVGTTVHPQVGKPGLDSGE